MKKNIIITIIVSIATIILFTVTNLTYNIINKGREVKIVDIYDNSINQDISDIVDIKSGNISTVVSSGLTIISIIVALHGAYMILVFPQRNKEEMDNISKNVKEEIDNMSKDVKKDLEVYKDSIEEYVNKNNRITYLLSLAKSSQDEQSRITNYNEILNIDSQNKIANYELANYYLNKSEYNKSFIYYSKIFSYYPDDVMIRHGIATVYYALGNYEESEKIIDESIRKFPDFVTFHELKGDIHLSYGKSLDNNTEYLIALDEYKKELNIRKITNIFSYICNIKIGDMYIKLDDFKAAEQSFLSSWEEIINLPNIDFNMLNEATISLYLVYFKNGEIDKVISMFYEELRNQRLMNFKAVLYLFSKKRGLIQDDILDKMIYIYVKIFFKFSNINDLDNTTLKNIIEGIDNKYSGELDIIRHKINEIKQYNL